MADLVTPKRLILAPGETRDLYVDFQAYEEIKDDGLQLTGTPTTDVSPAGPTLGSPVISGTKVVVACAIDDDEDEGSFAIRFTCGLGDGVTETAGPISRKLKFDVADV